MKTTSMSPSRTASSMWCEAEASAGTADRDAPTVDPDADEPRPALAPADGSASRSGRGSHFPSIVISTGSASYFLGSSAPTTRVPLHSDTSRSADGPPKRTATRSRRREERGGTAGMGCAAYSGAKEGSPPAPYDRRMVRAAIFDLGSTLIRRTGLEL